MTMNNVKQSGGGSEATYSRVSRREILRKLAAAAGAGTAWPFLAASHPIYKHLCDEGTLAQADAALLSRDWKPQFLTLEQSNTLLALSEAIVPGSAKALVHRFIDLLLSVDTTRNQESFVQALSAMETDSTARFGKSFRLLNPEQQFETLSAAATMDGLRKDGGEESSVPNQPRNLHDHFDHLKGWISGAYYSSEAGMAELGWTGDRVFAKFPECAHPDEHI
jgi:Gluconate 2-dehydrogenase subunit 3